MLFLVLKAAAWKKHNRPATAPGRDRWDDAKVCTVELETEKFYKLKIKNPPRRNPTVWTGPCLKRVEKHSAVGDLHSRLSYDPLRLMIYRRYFFLFLGETFRRWFYDLQTNGTAVCGEMFMTVWGDGIKLVAKAIIKWASAKFLTWTFLYFC